MPTIADDGYSVKGCSIIYAPTRQAGEYSPLAVNPYLGCGHKCAYCYVPGVPGQPDRLSFNDAAVIKPGWQDRFLADARKYKALGLDGQVMMSFTSDPYAPHYYTAEGDPKKRDQRKLTEVPSITRWTFEQLRDHGMAFCALTKGGSRALADLDLFRPDRDAFASTLTSLDDAFSRKWESGAALPGDRLHALERFHAAGIFTWVSLEPTLDVEASLAIVDATHRFVDLYKVGRVNYLDITRTTDWEDYTQRMVGKLQALGKAHYIKLDLQRYLPAGYHNPLRVPQHH
jgi:DNA repair photolyase